MSEDCLPQQVKGHPPSAEKHDTVGNPDLMSVDEVAPDAGVTTSADDDARSLVRLIQCSRCSRPFNTPITLPCGHSLCKACLPRPHMRLNISYPDTPDRQTGIWCPVSNCNVEHPIGEVNADVTFSKLMEVVVAEVDRARTNAGAVQTTVTILPGRDVDLSHQEKTPEEYSRTLPGGQLLAFFTLAELDDLKHEANVIHQDTQPTEDGRHLDTALLHGLRENMIKELECQICYSTMFDPVTTPCGHTYCRRCLTRVLDHSNHCPACRRQTPIPASLSQQRSNAQISALLRTLCPDIVASRAEAIAAEESTGAGELDVPLFICTMAFPGMPTFLHIFEPRYRLMMRRAVETNRLFGMLIYNRTRAPQGDLGSTEFYEYGTMLQIIHMQMLADGRSIIETRGLYRFRVLANGVRDGYHIGRVEKMEDVSLVDEERLEADEIRANAILPDSPVQQREGLHGNTRSNSIGNGNSNSSVPSLESMSTLQLFTKATDFVAQMRASSAPWLHQRILNSYGEPPSDPAAFPYWFASVLPIADEEKYVLLATTSVRHRLKIVVNWIRKLEGQRWYSGSNCTVL